MKCRSRTSNTRRKSTKFLLVVYGGGLLLFIYFFGGRGRDGVERRTPQVLLGGFLENSLRSTSLSKTQGLRFEKKLHLHSPAFIAISDGGTDRQTGRQTDAWNLKETTSHFDNKTLHLHIALRAQHKLR